MAKKKYYVDKNHMENGIYKSWKECEIQKKKGGTNFIGFVTLEEAKAYISNGAPALATGKSGKKSTGKLVARPFVPDSTRPFYEVHSDGGAKGNPGEGGYGYVVVDQNHTIIAEGYGSKRGATNNQMELAGAIEGIKAVPDGEKVYFSTDSTYVYAGFASDFEDQPRFQKWEKKGWQNSSGPIKNPEQIKELYALGLQHDLECIPRPYIEGKRKYEPFAHGDKKDVDGKWSNPYNKICDRLANIGCADAFDGLEHKVVLIENGKTVCNVTDRELVGRNSIKEHDQSAPFFVGNLDENRHGTVTDSTGKDADVN